MVAWAEHQFKLNKPTKGGQTLREHLEFIKKQTGRNLPELEGPEMPEILGYIWSAFIMLNNSRTMAAYTANPIPLESIVAYKELTNVPLTPRDVETIKEIDKVYLRVMNKDG